MPVNLGPIKEICSSEHLMPSKDSIESSPFAFVSELKGKIWKEKPTILPGTSGTTDEREKFEMAEIHISSPFPSVDGAPQSISIGETITTILSIENVSSSNYARLVAVRIDSSQPKGSFTLCYRGSSSASSSSSSSQPVKSEVINFPGSTGSMEPGRHIMLDLSFTPKRPGLSTVSIVVDIGEKEIVRSATLLARGYTSREKEIVRSATSLARGYTSQQKQDYDFPVPDHLTESFRMKRIPEILLEGLSEEAYCEYFSTLLYLEDLHLKVFLRCIFDIAELHLKFN